MAAILEAASQVLQAKGEGGMTTTAVAARAGCSVGTLYQYFPNRDAILLAIAERDRFQIAEMVRRGGSHGPALDDERLRLFVRKVVLTFRRRIGARRQFALMAEPNFGEGGLFPPEQIVDLLAEAWAAAGSTRSPDADRIWAFVLSRAVGGVLRAAALEDGRLLERPEFEDALCALIRALVKLE